jgi:hypothetical protein
MALNIVSGDRVKPGSRPVSIVPSYEEGVAFLAEAGIAHAYLVPLAGDMLGVYLRTEIINPVPAPSDYTHPEVTQDLTAVIPSNHTISSSHIEGSTVTNQPEPVPPPSDTELQVLQSFANQIQVQPVEEEIAEVRQASEEQPKKYVWAKIYPQDIRKQAKIRCIAGSNAGMIATVMNVVQEGRPDAETSNLAMQAPVSSITDTTGADVDAIHAQQIANNSKLIGIHGRPHNVTIKWDDPKDAEITTANVVNGIKMNSQTVKAPVEISTYPKSKICSDFMILKVTES